MLAYRSLHGTAPAYIAESLQLGSRIEGRHLRSTDAMDLFVAATRFSTLGDRSFSVAAARAWNALPSFVRLSPSLYVFRRHLKTELVSSVIPRMNFFLCHFCFWFCNCFVKCPSNGIAVMRHYNLNL